MSLLTPFIRREEVTPPEETTYVEVNQRMIVAVAPQLPPERPIPTLVNPRVAKMPHVFFLHPHEPTELHNLYRGATIRHGAAIPRGMMSQWGKRFNVKRPVPETYGDYFELGGDDA